MIRRVAAGLCFLALAGATTRAEESARSVGDEINTIRWREDYSFLRDRPELTLLERLKFISLNERETVYLTLGGEVRERAEDYNLAFFGLRGGTSFASYGTRLLADADLHVGPRFRTFLELGSFWDTGRKPAARPIDRGDLEVQQGFVDFLGLDRPDSHLTLRLGRQEVPLGAGRLVSIRDASSVRLVFDAAKVIWDGGGRGSLEVFAGRPVDPKPGVFESGTSHREWLWYADWSRRGEGDRRPNAELFYIGHEMKGAVYGRGTATETRHNLGGRIWGRLAPGDYSLQASYQLGSFGSADIRAWGVATDTGYTLAFARGRPRLALRADMASGDRGEPGTVRSFSAPYPALNYFSEAAIFAPGNGYDLHPYVEARPVKQLSTAVGVDFLWR
ncbi:MAG TPA: alginate export family protein, partial [Vicinamibacteria bacterium]|nr:alginate export family protein [Vicinamibacteria bacterium]